MSIPILEEIAKRYAEAAAAGSADPLPPGDMDVPIGEVAPRPGEPPLKRKK